MSSEDCIAAIAISRSTNSYTRSRGQLLAALEAPRKSKKSTYRCSNALPALSGAITLSALDSAFGSSDISER
jgi:hypothetical protein